MNNKKINKALGNIIFYLGNTIVGLIFVSPLLWMLASSFKPELEIFSNLNSLSTFIPKNFTLANYVEVFERIKVFTILKNTLIYIGIVLIGDLLLGSMFGYALAKMKYRFRGISLTVVIALMSMPVEAIILPLYIEMAQLNWVNTMLGLTIPFMMNCFSIYMFYSYFISIPDELIEAAKAVKTYSGENTLYKDEVNKRFILVLKKNENKKDFASAANILSEYGVKLSATTFSEDYYKEHFKVMVKENAISQIAKI